MEQDEEVVTEEPQLRYWNPWHRGRSVFTASATPLANTVNSSHFVKMEPQPSVYCDSNQCLHPSSVYGNLQSFNQDLQFQIEYQNNHDAQKLHQAQTSNEPTIAGLSTLTPLDTVPLHNQSSFLYMRQDEDIKKFIKQEPEEELEELKPFQEVRDDIVTFNSIDEALDSIDPSSTPDSNRSSTTINSLQGNGNKMVLNNEKHEEVVKAAKSLFSKRTRTLYHWLFPDTSKNKLKATVSAAWDTLSEGEKHFYISQVLGRFGLQASSLMVNPQLGGMKYIPNEVEKSEKKKYGLVEDQQAVDSLFDSCEDAGNWASYSEPKPIVNKVKPERKQRKKRQKGQKEQDGGSLDVDIEKEMKNLKKLKKVHKGLQEFEEDPELTKELEKFRLITEAAEEDIWGDIPDPEELFAEIAF